MSKFEKEKAIISSQGNTNVFGKLATSHGQNIRDADVAPLLERDFPLNETNKLVGGKYAKEPIAIVGMSCRYPQSNNLEEFWELLFNGKDGTSSVPSFRWSREHCSKQRMDAGKINAGFLSGPVDEFDGKFFGEVVLL